MTENEKQMAAFIEALKPHIQTLVEEQLGGFKKNAERLLDEVKDNKRRDAAPTFLEKLEQDRRDAALADANLVRNPDGTMRLASGADTNNAVILTREQARSPAAYREAKARAEARGVPLRIASDGQDPTMRSGKAPVIQSKTFSFDDTHDGIRYVRHDMHSGDGMVQRQMAAEREGLKLRTFRTLDDLPAHARQKFELMEAAANANGNT